jgi:hypothetical protein
VGALEVKKQALLLEDSLEKCAISSREDNSHALGLEYILPTELRSKKIFAHRKRYWNSVQYKAVEVETLTHQMSKAKCLN